MKKTLFLFGMLLASLSSFCLQAQEYSKAEKIVLKPTGRYADLKLKIKGKQLWIDLNRNEQFDEGEKLQTLFIEKQSIPLQDRYAEVAIYGEKIEKLTINDPQQDRQLYGINLKNAPSLTHLDVCKNSLGELDLTACSALTEVKATENTLRKIDATGCTSLSQLKCSSNPGLKDLILVDCSALTWLEAEHCAIEAPFLRGTRSLKNVFLDDNQLTSLNIPMAAGNLYLLSCSENANLQSLELRQQGNLNKLYVANCGLTSLDLSKAYALTDLDCSRNELTELNLSACASLTTLKVHQNHIKAEEMKSLVEKLNEAEGVEKMLYVVNTTATYPREENECPRSAVQRANEKKWSVFDYKGGDDPVLYLGIPDEEIPGGGSSSLGEYVTITTTQAAGETLTLEIKADDPWVDLNGNNKKEAGEQLENGQNDVVLQDLKTLNVYGKNMQTFVAVFASLSEVNTSNAPNLKRLELNNNSLKELSLSANKHLERVDLSTNKLQRLILPKASPMALLNVAYNSLEEVDLSDAAFLKQLWCNNNKLSALDVSAFTRLEELYLWENQIGMQEMAKIVAGLNSIAPSEGAQKRFFPVNTASTKEGNHISKGMIKTARGKQWIVFDFKDKNPNYEGEEDIVLGDKSQSITFSTELPAGEKLAFYLKGEKCWIDLNGNGSCDADEELKGDDSKTSVVLTATGQQTIYGAKILSLQMNEMGLTVLDLTQAPDLQKIWASDNKIAQIKLGKAEALANIDLSTNQIAGELDLSVYPLLEEVYLVTNQLTAVKLGQLPKLKTLSLSENKLSALDLSGCPHLDAIYASSNQLTALDLAAQTEIQTVSLWLNKINKDEMIKLVASLHGSAAKTHAGKELVIAALDAQGALDAKEGNRIREDEVYKAKSKEWKVLAWRAAGGTQEYAGITTAVEQMAQPSVVISTTAKGWVLQCPSEVVGKAFQLYDLRGQLLRQGVIAQNTLEITTDASQALLCVGGSTLKLQR